MANGKLNLGKQSGGVLSISFPDGVSNTEVVLPESGTLATKDYVDSKPSGFKNLLINPNFTINKRGYVSGTATTTANQYCHDRWRVPTSGQNVTFSTVNGVTTVTAPASGYEQVIENINNVGGTFFLSNQGTATAVVSQSSDNITYTPITPNVDGSYTVIGGYHIKINFKNGTIIKPQFEQGIVATNFDNRPNSLEMLLCFRYLPFVEGANMLSTCGTISSTNLRYNIYFKFPTQVRTSPTGFVNTALSNFKIGDNASISDTPASMSFQGGGIEGVLLYVIGTTPTSGIGGRAAFLVGVTSSAKIYFTGCEL